MHFHHKLSAEWVELHSHYAAGGRLSQLRISQGERVVPNASFLNKTGKFSASINAHSHANFSCSATMLPRKIQNKCVEEPPLNFSKYTFEYCMSYTRPNNVVADRLLTGGNSSPNKKKWIRLEVFCLKF